MNSTSPSRIKPLSIQLANQIAAGEVVERPASVVKELMENSIDANSTIIEVEIVHGGKTLIQIKDNGSGIPKDDLSLALCRHATSKLSTIEDLQHINSLGFRGEALASISSISRLSIQSKFKGVDKAWEIDTATDTDFTNYQAQVVPTALSSGTLIKVRDLFYNTPARRKFLRTDKTEFRFIYDIFKRIALSHFNVSFKLTHNKKLIQKLSICDDKSFRLKKIFTEDFGQQFITINESSHRFSDFGHLELSGWISNKSYCRHQADQQFFYVNGRYVRDKLLNHALRQVYQETLPAEQYASYILYLSIDPGCVDVNVHPTKYEVRFSQTRMVHDFIVSALSRYLVPSPLLSEPLELSEPQLPELANNVSSDFIQSNKFEFDDNKNIHYQPNNLFPGNSSNYSFKSIPASISGVKEHVRYLNNAGSQAHQSSVNKLECDQLEFNFPLNRPDHENKPENSLFEGRILSRIGSILIVEEENNNLCLIDSLKLAKHYNYHCLSRQIKNVKSIESFQLETHKLLIPENINLSSTQCDFLLLWQSQLSHFAIQFSLFGDSSIMLRSLPKLAFSLDCPLMISSLVNFLSKNSNLNSDDSLLNGSNSNNEFIESILIILSDTIEISQAMDDNKQLLIINHLEKFRDLKSIRNSYKILNENEMSKIISQ